MSKNKKLILILVICGVVLAGLVLAGGVAAVYFYFNGQYHDALDKQKETVGIFTRSLEQGSGDSSATLGEECEYYKVLDGKIDELPAALAELNEDYPLLLNKATDESAGIKDLQARMDALAPKLAQLSDTIGEDESVANSLSDLLDKDLDEGSTKAYQDLAGRNTALEGVVSSLSFTGSLEEKRKAFAEAVGQRGLALAFFIENSAVQDEFRALTADVATGPAELSQKFAGLLERCEALDGKLSGVNLKGIAPDSLNFTAAFSERKVAIQANLDYLTDAAKFQTGLQDYCASLEKAVAKGKFLQKLDTYIKWLAKLEGFDKSLRELNALPKYVNVSGKRTMEGLGLSKKGKMVLSFNKALKDVKATMATSASIDTQITKLLANKSAKPASIKKSAQSWAAKNKQIITALSVALPEDLKAGAAKVVSGCKVRAQFLTEWISYQDDKSVADTHNASYSSHMRKAESYAETALDYYWYIDGYWSSTVEKYYQLMVKEQNAAKAEKGKANASMKLANAHKKNYEAHRKKYLPLMNP